MMRKLAIAIIALSACCNVFSQNASDSVATEATRPEIRDSVAMFGVGLPLQSKLSDEAAELLTNKVSQILGRCNAGAGGDRGPFIIEPTLTPGDKRQSEGMVQNVTVLGGELTLAAKQRYTGQLFHSATFPISATLKGAVPDEEKALAKAIKTTDAAYVRFVRNARKNILDYGLKHPEIWDVPEVEPEVVRDTTFVPVVIVVEKQAEPQAAPAPAPAPAQPAPAQPAPAPAPQPAQAAPTNTPPTVGDIFISEPNWKVMIRECEFVPDSRQIHVQMTVLNSTTHNYEGCYTRITKAINIDGGTYKQYQIDNSSRDYPYDIPVTLNFYINDVYSNPGMIPFLEIRIENMKIEIRNLSVR